MSKLSLKSLVAKLNETCRQSLEGAAGLCLSRTNYNVEIEHWITKILENQGTDLDALFRFYEVDGDKLRRDLEANMDKFKTGNGRPPALSGNLVTWMSEALLFASLEAGDQRIRSGYLLYALVSHDDLSRMAGGISSELEKINPDSLKKDIFDVISETVESNQSFAKREAGSDAPAGPTSTPALDQFTIDLTERARNGEIDPILGRDPEIRQIIDILTRRRQNNPILTGEAGVGKTAVVEGFAQRIVADDVPPPLRGVAVKSLDLGLLQAGAGVKGEFENRLRSVIDEVKSSPTPIIMFIDEAHTLVGAGGQAGQGDAANLLKPALARGELRTVAATTWAEYKKYFEQDAALTRRFQVVKVEEPSEPVCLEMLRGLATTLEQHHNVRILEEGLVDAVRLSHRYIAGRQLPDKAVSLLDTACARVNIGFTATPPVVEDAQREIIRTETEIRVLNREAASGSDHRAALEELEEKREAAVKRLETLETQWKAELELVEQIRDIREQLEAPFEEPSDTKEAEIANPEAEESGEAQAKAEPPKELSPEEAEALRNSMNDLTNQLHELQGEEPLMQPCVDAQAVAEVVASWTGIPVGRMVSDEINQVLNLKENMEKNIVGQSHGLEAIAQSIHTARASLGDPRTPIGVFMLAGPSGVGKTETAITLAELLYGGTQNMTVINMSEYKEEHKVSLLMGSPPGYVGFKEGGVLTEAVRRKPYSVVLLDEVEKAHPSVQEVFYQVFDKGSLRDGEGRDIDFKNTIILLTSNAGTDLIASLCEDEETRPSPEKLGELLHEELLKTFKPAFLGRCKVVPYYPLSESVLKQIVGLKLEKIANRIRTNYKATVTFSDELTGHIANRCQEATSGARNIDNLLTRSLLPELSREFLARMGEGQEIESVDVSVDADGNYSYDIK